MKRWYDKHKKLAKYLEQFKDLNKRKRDELCTGIIDLMHQNDSGLIDNKVLEFPLDLPQRRWYDKDPYLWLVFNGLSKADEILLKEVNAYLSKHLPLK